MERVAVIARLRHGREPDARELIDAGPPFDMRDTGLVNHSVFVGNGTVVFLFEGDDLERRLTKLVNDPVLAAGFGAWAPVLAESPRVAHEAYQWNRKEHTMKTIVIATDGSPSALEAVEYGLDLAAEQDAEPVVVHVAPSSDVLPVAGFGMGAPVSVPHKLDEHDRAALDEAIELASTKGLHARAELLVGHPAHAIAAYAASIEADLIVIGSRGYGAIAGALLGSVSRGVLHEASCPVLVVRTAADRVPVA
jgi:nucleotide-binding universal stress UspA family protein